jgi:UDP-N-acetyl-D-galactosamine dehydrogenase
VLEAAGTKWNFLKFKPGLVGGHCIGVDPYYLAQKAQEVGYNPEIILAGRRMNDGMGGYIANEVVKLMIKRNIPVKHANVLILGVTFKENCPDVRNTRVVDIISELSSYDINITVYDPWASPEEVKHEYGIVTGNKLDGDKKYDAIVLAVAHDEFMQQEWKSYLKQDGILYDVKGCLEKSYVDHRL